MGTNMLGRLDRICPAICVAILCGCATSPARSFDHSRWRDEPGAPPRDGQIASMQLIVDSGASEYFAISYWSDGLRVKGFLALPKGSKGMMPAVVWNRGGNRDYSLLDPRQLVPYAEAGFVAIGSQYRGGGGSEGRDEFGGADVRDVLNLVSLLRQMPQVDPQRVAMVGYSRGGMMTYRALREDAAAGLDGIRVAAVVGGAADLLFSDSRSDMDAVYEETVGCLPAECPLKFRERSAVNWPGDIRVPLLLLHGELDARVPVEQSRRMACLMAKAGRDVKIITFPGEDHGLSGHFGGLREILDWFEWHFNMPRDKSHWDAVVRRTREVLANWPPQSQLH